VSPTAQAAGDHDRSGRAVGARWTGGSP